LQKEHDPSKLLADTPCKLLRFLVADGSHVDADTPYAEVEVMKMCMPLLLPASGVIHFVMPEGQAMQVLLLSISISLCLHILSLSHEISMITSFITNIMKSAWLLHL
jgi:acetyl-CoA carboxylase/biotin carboxylase 1